MTNVTMKPSPIPPRDPKPREDGHCAFCGKRSLLLVDNMNNETPWCSLECAGRELLHVHAYIKGRWGDWK